SASGCKHTAWPLRAILKDAPSALAGRDRRQSATNMTLSGTVEVASSWPNGLHGRRRLWYRFCQFLTFRENQMTSLRPDWRCRLGGAGVSVVDRVVELALKSRWPREWMDIAGIDRTRNGDSRHARGKGDWKGARHVVIIGPAKTSVLSRRRPDNFCQDSRLKILFRLVGFLSTLRFGRQGDQRPSTEQTRGTGLRAGRF
ncbi:unnamed protein product, partial [Mycena citricolor]